MGVTAGYRGRRGLGRIPAQRHVHQGGSPVVRAPARDRLSGRPVVRGRRIAAEDVALMAEAPGGVELLRRDYELTDD
jgi:uncharacterized protein (DUF433 family)